MKGCGFRPGTFGTVALAAAVVLFGAASSGEPAAPAFSADPAANCAIYAAALQDPAFGAPGAERRVVNHVVRRPAAAGGALPTSEMAARADAPWNEAAAFDLLLAGPAGRDFLPIACPWRRLGLSVAPTSRDQGPRITLSRPVLAAGGAHSLVYVQVLDANEAEPWTSYVCAAARGPQGWRGQGCVLHDGFLVTD